MSLNLPNASAPWVSSDGRLTPTAVRALTALWQRTGSALGDGGDDVFSQFGLAQEQQSEQVVSQPAPSPDVVEIVQQPLQPAEAWPIGSIFISTTTTDPALLLGYGTWTAYGAGQAMFGFASGDPDFGTLGGTGGVASITIDDHDHHTHSVSVTTGAVQSGAGTTVVTSVGGSTGNESPTLVHTSSGVSPIQTLPPYIVVNFWKRVS